jgi:hypothetical protein
MLGDIFFDMEYLVMHLIFHFARGISLANTPPNANGWSLNISHHVNPNAAVPYHSMDSMTSDAGGHLCP